MTSPSPSSAAWPSATAPALRETAELGLWIFLATEVLFFGGLWAAYLHGRAQWPAGFAEAGRHTDVVLGTLNTSLLLASSALVKLADDFHREDGPSRWTPRLLAGAALLGLAFLAVKGLEYRHDWQEHLVPGPAFALAGDEGAELFFVLYFVMTALHGVHLVIGIGLLGAFAWGTARRAGWAGPPRRLQAAGLYWHFVDIVWIVLYPLLYLAGRAS